MPFSPSKLPQGMFSFWFYAESVCWRGAGSMLCELRCDNDLVHSVCAISSRCAGVICGTGRSGGWICVGLVSGGGMPCVSAGVASCPCVVVDVSFAFSVSSLSLSNKELCTWSLSVLVVGFTMVGFVLLRCSTALVAVLIMVAVVGIIVPRCATILV